MATLARIRVHPIKSLAPVEVDHAGISPAGGLEGDRVYAIVDEAGEYVNGKRTADVHRLVAAVDLDASVVTIGVRGSPERSRFHLEEDRDALAEWLSAYFGFAVDIESATGGELTDSRVLGGDPAGVSVVASATLEAVAAWFPDSDVAEMRRRFRPNLEVAGVEAFWEDRLLSGEGPGARCRIGEVEFRGFEPIPRCVVPTRDPATGEPTPGFRERFVERRRASFPAWADAAAFDHFNALTTLAVPADPGPTGTIEIGDRVELMDPS